MTTDEMEQRIGELSREKSRLIRALQDLSVKQIFKGNSVSYIYDKMRYYRQQVGIAGNIIRKHKLMDEFENALEAERNGNW